MWWRSSEKRKMNELRKENIFIRDQVWFGENESVLLKTFHCSKTTRLTVVDRGENQKSCTPNHWPYLSFLLSKSFDCTPAASRCFHLGFRHKSYYFPAQEITCQNSVNRSFYSKCCANSPLESPLNCKFLGFSMISFIFIFKLSWSHQNV